MKSLQKFLITLTALTIASAITVTIFYKWDNSSISLTEEWAVTDVADGNTITVRQTDGSQMEVKLCGIELLSVKQGQLLSDEANKKLRALIAAADNQVMIIPVARHTQGHTVAEVVTTGKDGIEISVQEEMLKSGLAYHDKNTLNCPNALAFSKAQEIAKASRVGVWRQSKLADTP
ncbi:thermonuclease family protein (plasmid) [Nostoc sp. UHCC 0302]|uniref:thermonuclease family protein n=1 Tax=Nostoc sp. UHCC 0302 TaxID=3134896 RepID=UPI00311C8C5B